MRAAVEWEFISIGEALNNLSRVDSGVSARIDQAVRIIGFRNKLKHEYDRFDDALVWGVIQSYLQRSRSEAGQYFCIGDIIGSRLLNLDARPPSHRQWNELQHIP